MNVVSNNKILNEKKNRININKYKEKSEVKNKYFKWGKYFYYKS